MRELDYSNAERKLMIEIARGMSDGEVLSHFVVGVLGSDRRKELIVCCGELMGFQPSEALRIAQRAGIVATVRSPDRI